MYVEEKYRNRDEIEMLAMKKSTRVVLGIFVGNVVFFFFFKFNKLPSGDNNLIC